MAYSRKRPTGGYGGKACDSARKSDFEEWATRFGGFTVERVCVGEWNERREFSVQGKVVGASRKGERTDWMDMIVSMVFEFGDESQKAEVRFWAANC